MSRKLPPEVRAANIKRGRLKKYWANPEKYRAYAKQWNTKNVERIKVANAVRYQANKENIKARVTAYAKANKEKISESQKRYAVENKEKIAARHRRYVAANRAKVLERGRKWREENKDKITTYMAHYCRIKSKEQVAKTARWRKNNPEHARALGHQRRLKERATTTDIRQIVAWERRWRSKRWATCYWCRKKILAATCHSDHITAVVNGGAHSVENLCISCVQCNCSKRSKPLGVWNQHLTEPTLF